MKILVEKNIAKCKTLWGKFSPNDSLWDIWGVSYSFYSEELYEPFFIVVIWDDKPTGLLPLLREKDDNYHLFFGSIYMENRKLWFDHKLFPKLIKVIKAPILLNDINGEDAKKVIELYPNLAKYFKQDDFRYVIDLEKFGHNLDKYLATFSKKHRKNFKNDIKKLENLGYIVEWETTKNFDKCIELSKERFGAESDFSDPEFTRSIKALLLFLESKNMLHTLIIKIGDQIQGIEYAALYNGVYHVINGSYNRNIKNLGKLLMLEHIKKAIEFRAKMVDFLSGDSGWKELWNLEKIPYYTFFREKNAGTGTFNAHGVGSYERQ